MDTSLLFLFFLVLSDKHLRLALMAWFLLSGCACKLVGVAKEARATLTSVLKVLTCCEQSAPLV